MRRRILFVLLAGLLLTGCAAKTEPQGESAQADTVTAATMERYREGERKEYNGETLDPVVGPRDNSIKGVQTVDIASYTLTLDGLVNAPLAYSYEDITSMPSDERLLRLYCVEGWDANILWQGVELSTLLTAADPKAEANTVIFHAVDGYTTSLPLQEILDKNLILAYNANGIVLPPEMGFPLILVAEDKWGYKWARWINRIELSSNEDYQGYWEGYGYSNEGDLDKPSLG